MEIREVEAFLAVADELHFGRAAARLHVTTTRVSQNVRSLERRIGAPLFERSTRRVNLTPLGERLLADLRPAYLSMETALSTAAEIARQRSAWLRLAFATSMSRPICTELVEAFQQHHPHCQVVRSVRPAWAVHDQQTPALGDLDVFVTWAPGDPNVLRAPGCTVGPALRSVPRAILIGTQHPLAGRASVDIEELAEHPLLFPGTGSATDRMSRYLDAWTPPHTPQGSPLHRIRRLHDPYVEELIAIVAEGRLAHITFHGLTDVYQHQDITIVPLTGMAPMIVAPIWRTANRNPMVQAFIEANTPQADQDQNHQ
ncbi:LysR family transcriptional regulator [Actinomadura barringtoniae]|uniref:LysR family transcriptional regulator n=1 Tax=Actinomadura barringtoniae TaxID=1427535 RepID=A0A939T3Y3_9ACTN|nr:LysR family transcriptional regulator [Actinomadura barringtoniae]MBO2451866.1 LysR family transcriptional regulator [Actinomadura barringtoniae]